MKKIESYTTDKGYYSKANEKKLIKSGVTEVGMQRPGNVSREKLLSSKLEEKLANRRSGIEPLIGHVKQNGQLGRSRMKSDRGTEAAGFSAIMGFNLRQLTRNLTGNTEASVVF